MSRPATLQAVVKHGLCTGCGLCELLLGRARVEMRLTDEGYLRPSVKAAIPPEELAPVLAACPGATLTGPGAPSEAATFAGAALHPVWGPVTSIQRVWAGDPAVRHHAAAGGALTALGCFLLTSGRAEAVLHVKASTSQPMLSDAQVSTTPAEVIAGAQSRYGPAAPLVHVNCLLDEGRRFAVVAKPCDVAAVRALMRQDARARRQIVACLTIFCGGVPYLATAEDIARFKGLDPAQLTLFRWRGEGWPGPIRMESRDGRSAEMTYDEAWYNPAATWSYAMQFRCKICPDAIGELADVACPDGWIMEDGKPIHREAPGINIAIARTVAGRDLVEAALAAGALQAAPFTVDELFAMHGDHLDRKLGSPARLAGLRLAGEPVPRITGFRRWTTLRRAGLRASWRAFVGAFRRARAGANREVGT